jgi:hypothetical protein
VKFCPTGGVGPANIKSYMALKNVMCVGGSWMLDPEWIKNGDWARIQEVTAEGWRCWTDLIYRIVVAVLNGILRCTWSVRRFFACRSELAREEPEGTACYQGAVWFSR